MPQDAPAVRVTPTPDARKAELKELAKAYRDQLDQPALDYLATRGFSERDVAISGFGVVREPRPGHESVTGYLAIPYITPGNGVRTLRFRCIQDHSCKDAGHGKYWGEPGVQTGPYNTRALAMGGTELWITEGEIDAATLHINGLPAIGIAGANAWKSHYPRMLAGFNKITLLADGDEAGQLLASSVRKSLWSQAHVMMCEQGEDVNSYFVKNGRDALIAWARGEVG